MAYTRAEWNRLQRNLPPEDRISYEEYIGEQIPATTPATPAATAQPAATQPTAGMEMDPRREAILQSRGIRPEQSAAPAPTPTAPQPGGVASRTQVTFDVGPRAGQIAFFTYDASGNYLGMVDAQGNSIPDSEWTDQNKFRSQTASAGGTTTGTTTAAATTGTTTAATTAAATAAAQTGVTVAEQRERQSIMDTLIARFNQYNLGALANKIRELAIDGATEATITLALQDTPEYKQRFAANQARLKNNLRVLSPAEYLNLEDGYRQVLRAYGLKQFDTDDYVRQFIENDVSAAELSDRVVTAVQRVQNADPAVAKTLRDYYGIDNTTLVAYVLDPQQQLTKIQRQVAAAEIGTAARRQGLEAGVGVAEQLAAQGITQAEAQRGYATIADILPTAEKLSAIYGDTMAGYGQAEAEQEVFNQLATAQRRREALVKREQAAFSGQAGLARTALTGESRGQF